MTQHSFGFTGSMTSGINWSDGIPYSISTVHVAERLVEQKRTEFESQPVLPTLRLHFRHELHSGEQTLTVRIADAMAAKQLSIDIGMPVVRVVRPMWTCPIPVCGND